MTPHNSAGWPLPLVVTVVAVCWPCKQTMIFCICSGMKLLPVSIAAATANAVDTSSRRLVNTVPQAFPHQQLCTSVSQRSHLCTPVSYPSAPISASHVTSVYIRIGGFSGGATHLSTANWLPLVTMRSKGGSGKLLTSHSAPTVFVMGSQVPFCTAAAAASSSSSSSSSNNCQFAQHPQAAG